MSWGEEVLLFTETVGGEIVVFHPVGRRNDGINGHGKDIGIEDTDFRVQAESFMPGFDQVVIHVN